jgi:hypothetical protein
LISLHFTEVSLRGLCPSIINQSGQDKTKQPTLHLHLHLHTTQLYTVSILLSPLSTPFRSSDTSSSNISRLHFRLLNQSLKKLIFTGSSITGPCPTSVRSRNSRIHFTRLVQRRVRVIHRYLIARPPPDIRTKTPTHLHTSPSHLLHTSAQQLS